MSKNKLGTCDGKQDVVLCEGAFYASAVLSAKSGRFVIYDTTSGYWKVAPDNADKITGYVEEHLTCSATSGGTVLSIISVRDRVFELPYAASGVVATLTDAVGKTLIGKLIDVYVASDIQYADNATSQAILRVEGYDVAENTLKVSVIDSAIAQDTL